VSRVGRAPRAVALSLPRLGRAATVALLVASLGVFHVWSRTRVVSAGYALGKLQKEHVRLTSEHDRLRIEVETLRSPATLERYARTRLGMAPPAPGAVQAAGPRLALAGGGGKDVDGVVTRSGPAEPALFLASPARPAGAGGASASGRTAAGTAAAPGVKLALRGPAPSGDAER
jgi:cell division protein FtsL